MNNIQSFDVFHLADLFAEATFHKTLRTDEQLVHDVLTEVERRSHLPENNDYKDIFSQIVESLAHRNSSARKIIGPLHGRQVVSRIIDDEMDGSEEQRMLSLWEHRPYQEESGILNGGIHFFSGVVSTFEHMSDLLIDEPCVFLSGTILFGLGTIFAAKAVAVAGAMGCVYAFGKTVLHGVRAFRAPNTNQRMEEIGKLGEGFTELFLFASGMAAAARTLPSELANVSLEASALEEELSVALTSVENLAEEIHWQEATTAFSQVVEASLKEGRLDFVVQLLLRYGGRFISQTWEPFTEMNGQGGSLEHCLIHFEQMMAFLERMLVLPLNKQQKGALTQLKARLQVLLRELRASHL